MKGNNVYSALLSHPTVEIKIKNQAELLKGINLKSEMAATKSENIS
jgi:hypothetical protein